MRKKIIAARQAKMARRAQRAQEKSEMEEQIRYYKKEASRNTEVSEPKAESKKNFGFGSETKPDRSVSLFLGTFAVIFKHFLIASYRSCSQGST